MLREVHWDSFIQYLKTGPLNQFVLVPQPVHPKLLCFSLQYKYGANEISKNSADLSLLFGFFTFVQKIVAEVPAL